VRVPETGEIAWRVRATAPGRHEVRIAVGGETASKSLPVDVEGTRIELVRHAGGLSNGFLHPGEAPIRTAGVASISVDLAGAEMDLWGWHVHWIWVFLVLTLVAALAMKDLFKVTF